jgi:hypothetical protein
MRSSRNGHPIGVAFRITSEGSFAAVPGAEHTLASAELGARAWAGLDNAPAASDCPFTGAGTERVMVHPRRRYSCDQPAVR